MKNAFVFCALWILAASCSQRSVDGDIPVSQQPAHTSASERIESRNLNSSLSKSDCDDQGTPGAFVRSDCRRYEISSDAATGRDRSIEDRMGGR